MPRRPFDSHLTFVFSVSTSISQYLRFGPRPVLRRPILPTPDLDQKQHRANAATRRSARASAPSSARSNRRASSLTSSPKLTRWSPTVPGTSHRSLRNGFPFFQQTGWVFCCIQIPQIRAFNWTEIIRCKISRERKCFLFKKERKVFKSKVEILTRIG